MLADSKKERRSYDIESGAYGDEVDDFACLLLDGGETFDHRFGGCKFEA